MLIGTILARCCLSQAEMQGAVPGNGNATELQASVPAVRRAPIARQWKIEKDPQKRKDIIADCFKQMHALGLQLWRKTGGEMMCITLNVDPEEGMGGKIYSTETYSTPNLRYGTCNSFGLS